MWCMERQNWIDQWTIQFILRTIAGFLMTMTASIAACHFGKHCSSIRPGNPSATFLHAPLLFGSFDLGSAHLEATALGKHLAPWTPQHVGPNNFNSVCNSMTSLDINFCSFSSRQANYISTKLGSGLRRRRNQAWSKAITHKDLTHIT